MSIRRHGNGWQVRVAPFASRTLPTRKAAQEYERFLKTRKVMGDVYRPEATTFGEESRGLLARKEATANLRENTRSYYRRCNAFWEPFYGLRMSDLRLSEVEDRISTRALTAPRSARNELEWFKAVLKAAERRGQHFDPRLLTVDPVRHQARRGVALTFDQLHELASWQPDWIRRMTLVAGTSAMRWGELVTLTDDRLVLKGDEPHAYIPPELNKSRKEKIVPLTETEVGWFNKQLMKRAPGTSLVFPTVTGCAWASTGHFNKSAYWTRARKAAELPHLHFHDLRHTATSLMCASGMRPEVVAERRGDADGGQLVLKTYRHLYPSERAQATRQFDRFLTQAEDSAMATEGTL